MPLLAGIEDLAPLLVYLLFFLGPLILRAILRASGKKDPDGGEPTPPSTLGPAGRPQQEERADGTEIWRRLLRGEPLVQPREPGEPAAARRTQAAAELEELPLPASVPEPPSRPATKHASLVTLESGELHASLPSEVRREALRKPLSDRTETEASLGGELAGDDFAEPLREDPRGSARDAVVLETPLLSLDRASVRRAILWREVLGTPVSLRSLEEPGSPPDLC